MDPTMDSGHIQRQPGCCCFNKESDIPFFIKTDRGLVLLCLRSHDKEEVEPMRRSPQLTMSWMMWLQVLLLIGSSRNICRWVYSWFQSSRNISAHGAVSAQTLYILYFIYTQYGECRTWSTMFVFTLTIKIDCNGRIHTNPQYVIKGLPDSRFKGWVLGSLIYTIFATQPDITHIGMNISCYDEKHAHDERY